MEEEYDVIVLGTGLKVNVGALYEVQWGRQNQCDTAIVLAAGNEKEMRDEMRDRDNINPPSPETEDPRSPTPPPSPEKQPTPKRRKVSVPKTKSGKPLASVVSVVTPPSFQPTIQLDNPDPDSAETAHMQAASIGSAELDTTFRLARPTAGIQQLHTSMQSVNEALTGILRALNTGFQGMAKKFDEQNRRIDVMNRRQLDLEKAIRSFTITQDSLVNAVNTTNQEKVDIPNPPNQDRFEGIPAEHLIEMETLTEMNNEACGSGNFAAHLTKRLFPELFGPGNLRFGYNWFGNGKLKKHPLDPVRKAAIRRYVCYFHPEVQDDLAWKERIVPKINELLRRTDKKQTDAGQFSYLGLLNS